MIWILISIIVVLVSGAAEGIMDSLQFHFDSTPFSKMNQLYWNPALSWKNKYKNGNPEEGEKFPLSTTFFVSFTDGWHTMKLIRNTLSFVGIGLIGWMSKDLVVLICLLILARSSYGIGFWLTYYRIKKYFI